MKASHKFIFVLTIHRILNKKKTANKTINNSFYQPVKGCKAKFAKAFFVIKYMNKLENKKKKKRKQKQIQFTKNEKHAFALFPQLQQTCR